MNNSEQCKLVISWRAIAREIGTQYWLDNFICSAYESMGSSARKRVCDNAGVASVLIGGVGMEVEDRIFEIPSAMA